MSPDNESVAYQPGQDFVDASTLKPTDELRRILTDRRPSISSRGSTRTSASAYTAPAYTGDYSDDDSSLAAERKKASHPSLFRPKKPSQNANGVDHLSLSKQKELQAASDSSTQRTDPKSSQRDSSRSSESFHTAPILP